MKSNALLKFLVPAVVIVVIFIVAFSGGKKQTQEVTSDPGLSLTAEEAKALGIEGDTPKDTLATVVAQLKAVRGEVGEVKKQNEDLKTENNRLRDRDRNIDSRINQAVQGATEQAKKEAESVSQEAAKATEQAKGLISELQDKFSGLGGVKTLQGAGKEDELPVGLGLEPGDGGRFSGEGAPIGRTAGHMIWIEPSDAVSTDPRGKKSGSANPDFTFPNSFQNVQNAVAAPFGEVDRSQKELRAVYKGEQDLDGARKKRNDNKKPHYTIAENSTLMGSVVMTALIGRIPVAGTVNDPYPFKVLLGRDNLAANGIELPEVTSAVMSGVATGDWTLSCVRGQVDSITFIFEDGTIRTVPEPKATVQRGQSDTSSTTLQTIRGGIGYISDPQGIPCVSGERRSNAEQYLTTQSLITAAGAGVTSLLSKEDGTSGSYSGSGGATVVSDRNAALNAVLAGGVADIRNWVNRLYGEAFAVIYVPPHADIAVHIDHELTIDYEPHGRKVNFHADTKKTAHPLD